MTILEANDDVATILLGNKWRIPTSAEMEELVKKMHMEMVRRRKKVDIVAIG